MSQHPAIFISYRRSDAAGHARALHRDLCRRFASEVIFFDRQSIESGDTFPDTLQDAVAGCKVVLALIGPEWLQVKNNDGLRRLEDPKDFVRQEISQALNLNKKIIPVLFDDTPPPSKQYLPEPLKALADCDALIVRGKVYEYDTQLAELVRLVAKVTGVPQPLTDLNYGGSGDNAPQGRASPGQKDTQRTDEQDQVPMRILHLSDLHCGTEENARQWHSNLASDLRQELDCDRLDAIIISGDVANVASEEEYTTARIFIERICETFKLERSNLIIVPGNHDQNWKLSKKGYILKYKEALDKGIGEEDYIVVNDEIVQLRDKEIHQHRFLPFSSFYRALKDTPYPLDYAQQGTIHYLKELDLLILGLNSAWQVDHHFKAKAGICPDAMAKALDTILQTPVYDHCLKFAVWHHPINSAFEDRITDHGFLELLAQNGFSVCFHGHLHKATTDLFRYDHSAGGRKIEIVGAGTFGAPSKQWHPGCPLQYNLLEATSNQITVKTRYRTEINGAWKPHAIWTQGPGKDPRSSYTIKLPQWLIKTPEPQTSEGGKPPKPATAFISYSHKDETFAVNLYRRLTKDGIGCWFDRESIEWGANWVCALEEGLDKCKDLVLLLSPDWCKSEWTKLEQSSIRAEDPPGFRKKLRPLLLKPCIDSLPRFLRPVQAIDVSTPEKFESAYPRISKTLRGVSTDPDLETDIKVYGLKAQSLYENLPLMGFRTKLRVPIRIEDIYVPLRAMLDLRATGDACFADAEDAERKMGRRDQCGEMDLPKAFEQANEMGRRGIVLLGDPGSGKTTHLKRVLLWCLQGEDKNQVLSGDMIPVFLPLRELTDLKHGLDAFIQAQLDKPHLGTPEGFGRRLLDRGRLLLLLDGLDEVADTAHRARVARWIEEALLVHSTCRFVVTSRFAGYTEKARLSEHFLEMHLRPLDFEQVKAFVQNWYRIVETGLSTDAHQAEVIAGEKSQKLIKILEKPEFRSRRVFELTRNPLLLTNICLVHRDRGNLPKSRVRLYEDCTEVLLELWRAAIGYETKVDAQSGRRVLQPAALWLHEKEGRTRATADELAQVIEPALKDVGWPHGDAKVFLRIVRDESGLLTGWDQETYGFMHLGFQEYLAARQIQNNILKNPAMLNDLARRFGQSWWQEVILLLLALDNPCLFEPFMEALVQKPAFVQHPDLVEMCLDDAAERPLKPFLDLLQAEPGKDRKHWQRQLAALKLLERLDNTVLNGLMDRLAQHPFKEIQQRIGGRRERAEKKTKIAPKGGYELVRIPGGEFLMGSPESEDERYSQDRPQHPVQVPDFGLGRYPVTNEEYGRYLAENPKAKEPEYWAKREFNQPQQPVVGVSWEDAVRYARWAGLQLPSEAQWEYACRAGTRTRYHSGDTEKDLDRAGWYDKNSGDMLHPVGEKEPNAFGLYDMHGNVWEWVEDDLHSNYKRAPDDGRAWVDDPRGTHRVIRGGAWSFPARICRAASRAGRGPDNRSGDLGLRLALAPDRQSKSSK